MSWKAHVVMFHSAGMMTTNRQGGRLRRQLFDQKWPSRYELLDGLRGVAALLVVLDHLKVVSDQCGHLAVMIFFVISGYCISAAARNSSASGFSLREFMLRRVRRIYPPYLLALVFFAYTRLVKWRLGGPNALHRSAMEWLQNVTLTQWLSDLTQPVAMPAQNATLFVPSFWSLNYEEQFYLVVGLLFLLGSRRPRVALTVAVGSGILGLIWNLMHPGNLITGFFLEYWAHFCLGCLTYFALTSEPDSGVRRFLVVVLAMIALACAIRVLPQSPFEDMRAMYELGFLVFAVIALLLLRPWSAYISNLALWRPLGWLGTISYSLYLIHQFNLNLVSAIALRLTPHHASRALYVTIEVALHVLLAWAFWIICERPFMSNRRARVESRRGQLSVAAETP